MTYDLNNFRRIPGGNEVNITLSLPAASVGFLLQQRSDEIYILKVGVNNKQSGDSMSVINYDDEGRYTYGFIIPDYIGITGENPYSLSYGLMGNTSITSAIIVQRNYFDVATLNIPTAAFNIPLLSGMNTSDANVDIAGVDIEYGKEVEITTNGTQIIQPNVGYEGMGELTIVTNVPGGGIDVQSDKTQTVTSNGNVTIIPDSGYEAMNSVDLTVAVPQPPMNPNKIVTYTANGSYRLDPEDSTYTNAVAMRKATVDVSVTPVISNTPSTDAVLLTSPYGSTTTVTPVIDSNTKEVKPTNLTINPNLKSLSITDNGSYSLTTIQGEGYCGYGPIFVDVPPTTVTVAATCSYISLSNNLSPTSYVDIENDVFTRVSTGNVAIPPGKTLVMIREASQHYQIRTLTNLAGASSSYNLTISSETNYIILNYELGGQLHLFVDNTSKIWFPSFINNNNIREAYIYIYKDILDIPYNWQGVA